ncbi:hypothetical protein Q5P01_004561 [Channa striata]|uniref:Uncharacterized protein n=1 Tax=Channa striata TaxID=64152 RepID=A0AA88NHF4_CHASR|nr:hypothetical protein Q5P01_004561 [Channa striata]
MHVSTGAVQLFRQTNAGENGTRTTPRSEETNTNLGWLWLIVIPVVCMLTGSVVALVTRRKAKGNRREGNMVPTVQNLQDPRRTGLQIRNRRNRKSHEKDVKRVL